METKYGNITVSPYLIAQIAARAALESYGIRGLIRGSFVKNLFLSFSGRKTYRGIEVVFIDDSTVEIKMRVLVEFGVSIPEVVKNLIERVRYDVERLTSLKVENVNVVVQGVKS